MPEGTDAALRACTVCFTGHRHLDEDTQRGLAQTLDALLEGLWRRGFRRFVCGGALGFDTLAAERVIRMQLKHGDMRLILAIPCQDQSKHWRQADCVRYERTLYGADETRVLSPAYYEGCMMVRNRYMVDRAALCVCYLNCMKGGTVATVAYALREKIPVLNVAMDDACAAFLAETP